MVVRNGYGGAVFDEIPELQTKFDPARSVFRMVIGLITGKEKHIGVNRF